MKITLLNPANGEPLPPYEQWGAEKIERALKSAAAAVPIWRNTPLQMRCEHLQRVAANLRRRRDELALTISEEMGKLIGEAEAEVDKCATLCDYTVEHAASQLADTSVSSDAQRSYLTYQPLGTLLAIMPWNFPLWQLFRAAVPALAAGNTVLLKHASNVPRSAANIASLFCSAGFPDGVLINLPVSATAVAGIIGDPRIAAVTFTGSTSVGRQIAATAAAALKPAVLELGGADPFIVLEDADLEFTITQALRSRFINCGQSCIAAKRFIVIESIADRFVSAFAAAIAALRTGDPLNRHTTLAPLARGDLRDTLAQQVAHSLAHGGELIVGGDSVKRAGFFYQPTLIDRVTPEQAAWHEELFGPVATVIRVNNEREALQVANQSRFGLGGSVWCGDRERGERLARQLQCGSAFVNGMVKSDPRLPFGGVKDSGYGRELAELGIRAFVNCKTVWIG
ncbi:MAG: NAD-dependent succinate-semialdehyde dehydrogenase [Gammaproteobacteria bacterium]|nr:NAD-dependent succinate-semialdehyde dehydrogenase [Gammaproteobacteria bacterium]